MRSPSPSRSACSRRASTRPWRGASTARHLVTEIHASELLESLRTQTEEHDRTQVLDWLAQRIEHTVKESAPDLDLGIQYTDEKGEPIASAGSLARESLPIPETCCAATAVPRCAR